MAITSEAFALEKQIFVLQPYQQTKVLQVINTSL